MARLDDLVDNEFPVVVNISKVFSALVVSTA